MKKSKEMVFYARDSKTIKPILFLNYTRASYQRVYKTERKQCLKETPWLSVALQNKPLFKCGFKI